jgi:hypothetical protein
LREYILESWEDSSQPSRVYILDAKRIPPGFQECKLSMAERSPLSCQECNLSTAKRNHPSLQEESTWISGVFILFFEVDSQPPMGSWSIDS